MSGIFERKKTLFLLILAIFFVNACTKKEKSTEEKTAATVKAPIYTIEKSVKDELYETSGTVVSRNPVKIASKVMGTVVEMKVEEGAEVKKGQLLVLMDAPEIKAMLDRANSAVVEAEKAIAMAQINAQHAENTYRRYERLYNEKAISQQEFESIKTKRDIAHDEVKRLNAVLDQAKAEKERAKAALEYTKIYAPISGIVTEKLGSVGLNVMPGTPLITIESNTNLRLEVNIDEKVLPIVKRGKKIGVLFTALNKELEGVIGDIVPAVDPTNRTFKLKIDLPVNPSIKLGMYGVIKLPIGKKDVITVPETAILNRGQLSYVYVLDSEGKAVLRLVRTGESKDGFVEILSGLSAGEKIVKEANKAVDGAKIIGE